MGERASEEGSDWVREGGQVGTGSCEGSHDLRRETPIRGPVGASSRDVGHSLVLYQFLSFLYFNSLLRLLNQQ